MITSEELWNQMSSDEQKAKVKEITDNLEAPMYRAGVVRARDMNEQNHVLSTLKHQQNVEANRDID